MGKWLKLIDLISKQLSLVDISGRLKSDGKSVFSSICYILVWLCVNTFLLKNWVSSSRLKRCQNFQNPPSWSPFFNLSIHGLPKDQILDLSAAAVELCFGGKIRSVPLCECLFILVY